MHTVHRCVSVPLCYAVAAPHEHSNATLSSVLLLSAGERWPTDKTRSRSLLVIVLIVCTLSYLSRDGRIRANTSRGVGTPEGSKRHAKNCGLWTCLRQAAGTAWSSYVALMRNALQCQARKPASCKLLTFGSLNLYLRNILQSSYKVQSCLQNTHIKKRLFVARWGYHSGAVNIQVCCDVTVCLCARIFRRFGVSEYLHMLMIIRRNVGKYRPKDTALHTASLKSECSCTVFKGYIICLGYKANCWTLSRLLNILASFIRTCAANRQFQIL
jgi:hypothetical protein